MVVRLKGSKMKRVMKDLNLGFGCGFVKGRGRWLMVVVWFFFFFGEKRKTRLTMEREKTRLTPTWS